MKVKLAILFTNPECSHNARYTYRTLEILLVLKVRNLPALDFMLYGISFTFFRPDFSYSVTQELHGSVFH